MLGRVPVSGIETPQRQGDGVTAEDRNLERFFENFMNVVDAKDNVISKSRQHFHYPVGSCFDGGCGSRGVFLTKVASRKCNWEEIMSLAAWFLKHGPDVDENWKKVAQAVGVDADDLHGAFLGVLVGGDGARTDYDPLITLREARTNALKALNAYGLFIPQTHTAKGTP